MKNHGFLLMDVLLAAAFMGVITITLLPTVAFLLRRNTTTQSTVEANLLIQEGIETTYNIFSNNWDAYSPGAYSLAVDTTVIPNQFVLVTPPTNDLLEARYIRTITIEEVKRSTVDGKQDAAGNPDPKSRKVTATVHWNENGEDVSHQASLLLYDL